MSVTQDVSSDKIIALQNIILEQASDQKAALISDARKEADAWLLRETEKLEREAAMVLADAKTRSEEIHRRQILSAEREKQTEGLRQQNRFLTRAIKAYQDGLIRLRDRPDYAELLSGLAASCARSLMDDAPLKLRLAALDAALGERVAAAVREKLPGSELTFDATPAPILGGCWVIGGDGRRQINADWQSRAQEADGLLADRLLALL